jgi:hypothetical protein
LGLRGGIRHLLIGLPGGCDSGGSFLGRLGLGGCDDHLGLVLDGGVTHVDNKWRCAGRIGEDMRGVKESVN